MAGYKYSPPSPGNVSSIRSDIVTEFNRWNTQAGERVITDFDLPYANQGTREAEVVFILRGMKMRVRIDAWDTFAVNLKCAALNIRDMRLAEARGSLEAMRETFLGLPAPARERDPYEILQIRPDASAEMVDAAYKTLAKKLHPDAGGTDAQFKELQAAYDKVKKGT